MTLILPLLGLFMFIGLTQTSLTRRIYIRMLVVILSVLLYYYVTAS